jgi:hypothetical protein
MLLAGQVVGLGSAVSLQAAAAAGMGLQLLM